jgi:purine-binding chemotaxis protein CheW
MVEKEKTDKALGLDPFADMEGLEWDGLAPWLEEEEVKVETRVDAETGLEKESEAVELEPAAEVEAQVPEVEVAVAADEPSPAPYPEREEEQKEGEWVMEVEEGEFDLLGDLIATVDQEVEAVLAADEPSPAFSSEREEEGEGELAAEPEEEAFDLLGDLIATIDQEVEEAFGAGAMADLAPQVPVGVGGEEQHVIFSLADTEYAAPITNVTEIGRPLDVTPVPNMPDWVLGVTNLRGDIISVVDMRTFLGMEAAAQSQASRMLVAQASQEDMTTSLIVDRVSGIRYLAVDRIGAPTAPIEDQVAPYLRGVYEHEEHLLVVLDFDKLLLSAEMRQFEPI